MDKPQRERQAEIPAGMISMMQTTAYDIEDHLGRYEASKGQASNERSGKAIVARIQQADKGTYTFIDNLTRAIVYAGRQLIDLIPKIYDTHRALRVGGEDEKDFRYCGFKQKGRQLVFTSKRDDAEFIRN